MNKEQIIEKLKEITEDEKRALAYIEKHGEKAKHAGLLEIYSIDIFDYVPKSLYELYLKSKSHFAMPDYITLNEDKAFEADEDISLTKADRYIEMFPLKHNFYEVNYIFSGKCEYSLEKQSCTLHSGDISIVPPGVIYQALPEDDCILINLKIRKSTFDKLFVNFLSSGSELSSYFTKTLYSKMYRSTMIFHCAEDEYVSELFVMMFGQQLEKKQYYGYMLQGLTITLFTHLIQSHCDDIEFSSKSVVNNDQVSHILNYINENYTTATLENTAKHFYLNSSYLSVLIKKELGKTFSELIREIKMNEAATLLLTTNLKIDEICTAVGYKDTTQFIKTFKKYYGLSPKKYKIETNPNHIA
ncbi:MAG: AraC family transcriptional regulator [Clostridium sp.]|nr:AraC family transcriptional regulator [Clostridium sp.]